LAQFGYEAKDNIELKFYLYSLLGLYSIKSENVTKAIENFQMALSLRPDRIICKTWLAEAYELIGDASQAIAIYKGILAQNGNKDLMLSGYFNEQIKKILTRQLKLPTSSCRI
jgi:tetratricopeptide (TPR) repeat protein